MFDSRFKKPMTLSPANPASLRLQALLSTPTRLMATGATVALLLVAAPAHSADSAQAAPAPVSTVVVPASEAPAPAASVPAAAPRYSASNLALAFGYMDANHDGKISREEAAGFSGVARHFDQADTNHDGFLSREEFDYAMNYVKPH